MRPTYTQAVKGFQESLKHSLILLKSDPNFQVFVDSWVEGREYMISQLCREGISQKDVDMLRGAIHFADTVIYSIEVNTKHGHGNQNTSRDSQHEHTNVRSRPGG